jgi:DNA-directed RNA polymerase specialized sigma subunit
MYDKYKNMIKKISWSFYKKTGIEYEEIEAQANLIFCESLNSYDSSIASFSTYLYSCLNNSLNNYIKNYKKYDSWAIIYDYGYNDNFENRLIVNDTIKNSKDLSNIYEICLNSEEKLTKKYIIKKLHIDYNYTYRQARKAIDHLRADLNNLC